MTEDFEEEFVSIDSERAKKLHKNTSKLLRKINKPQKFSLNKCFNECLESGDFKSLHIYLNSRIEDIGVQVFFGRIDVTPQKVRTALQSDKPTDIILLSKILKALDMKLSIKKH